MLLMFNSYVEKKHGQSFSHSQALSFRGGLSFNVNESLQ